MEFAVLLIYKMSISEYNQMSFVLKAPNGMVYNEIQAAYILRSRNNGLLLHLVSTKHYHCVCFRLSSHLYVLYMYLYVRANN